MRTNEATRNALRQALARATQPGVVYVPVYHLQDWRDVLADIEELVERLAAVEEQGECGEWVRVTARVDYRLIGEADDGDNR